MNFLRNCGWTCWSSSEVLQPELKIETEIESPVYDSVKTGKKQVEDTISNPLTKTIANPTGTMEFINPCYVKSAADIPNRGYQLPS